MLPVSAIHNWYGASALNALYRDIGYCIPFLLQMGVFACPVIYQTEAIIPERWRLLYSSMASSRSSLRKSGHNFLVT